MTDNAIIRKDGATAGHLQESSATIDDNGAVNIPSGQTYNIDGSPHAHAGGDADAIHDNVADEIHTVTEKATPADADVVLIEDSADSWNKKRTPVSALGGSGGGRTLISEQTPTATGTVTFDSIAGTYKSLELEIVARTDKVATATSMYLYFNNDTTAANYRRESLSQGGATIGGGVADNPDALIAVAASGLTNNAAYGTVKIMNYAATVFEKAAHIRTAYRTAASTSAQNLASVFWENTAAITRIDIVTDDASNYVTGTTFRLYGVP